MTEHLQLKTNNLGMLLTNSSPDVFIVIMPVYFC